MLRRFLFVMCILGLLPSSVQGAEVHGTGAIHGHVIAKDSESPIVGAMISLMGTTYGTVSDENGAFWLAHVHPGTYTLRVSYLGYKTHEKQVHLKNASDTLAIEFSLKPAQVDIDAIVVTATRQETALKDVPQLTEVITGEELQVTGAVTVQDALEMNIPGIEFSPDSHGANIQMQGLGSDYILILLDGERLAQQDRSNIDFNRLNTSDIERIEVTKGSASSLYGSNAIGGVINIITKKPQYPLEASASYRISKYGEQNINGMLGTKSDLWSAKLTINKKQSDGYDLTPETPTSYTQEKFEDLSLTPWLRMTPSDKLQLDFQGNYYQYERFDATTIPQHPRNYGFTLGSSANYYFSPEQSLKLSWHTDQYEQYDYYERLDEEELSAIHRYDNAKLIFATGFSKTHALTLGGEFLREKLVSDRITNGRKTTQNWIGFAQEEIQLIEKLRTVAGVQFVHHSTFGSHVSPRVSLLYQDLPFNIRLGYSHGFRTPTLKELYMDWDHFGMFFIEGTSDLEPETSNYFTGSLEFITERLNASILLYHNSLKNMIATVTTTEDGISTETYKNVSDARLQGFDLLLKVGIGRGLSLSGGYSFVDSKDLETDLEIEGVIRHTARLRAEYNYLFSRGFNLTLALQGKYNGGMIYESVNDDGEVERENYRPYWNWRLTASQQLFASITFTAGVDNIFDYTDTVDFSTITPGRRFFSVIQYSFN
ncbi:TonB-dependent receptor plug [Chloroherpeton thalassium ATCC 35110]|uniref:TonB-dependent receptor plug n=1 Tax=Chloroherpeton thalassium (strain ATCC 35110 / GB-78) TaxID=517418 RepID=B3QXU4_CHLT3|nr:TonB-dependent receptor [Chloroherpeton thalassium]ACF13472.1 TonB-dependent receptor plug [Chloroherpeton thalassium ATCC 35110]